MGSPAHSADRGARPALTGPFPFSPHCAHVLRFKIAVDAGDASGVQSLVSCIFMGAAFGAMVNMNQIVPALLGVRVVFYREQASAMYSPTAYQIAAILVELPWLAGILLVSTAVGYFMFGLVPNGFGFHYLAVLVLAVVYVSIGMAVASFVPTFEVAQAVLGLIGEETRGGASSLHARAPRHSPAARKLTAPPLPRPQAHFFSFSAASGRRRRKWPRAHAGSATSIPSRTRSRR